jgi:hypothetical protein
MPGGRPSKPIALVKGHRTKAEKEIREKAESKLLTGTPLREWVEVRNKDVAHKEFVRIRRLLKSINQDDDLYGAVINTHCKLKYEESEMFDNKEKFIRSITLLEDAYNREEIKYGEYVSLLIKAQGQIIACDKAIMQKRKLMLDISKENVMTIQSALRSVQKKPEEDTGSSPMAAFLKQRLGGNNAT